MEHGASEGEWANFLEDWARYKRSSNLRTEIQKIDQLWGCLSTSLKSSARSDKLGEKDTEVALLVGIKKLAVKVHNVLISQVQFLQLSQDREEPIRIFRARLRGAAAQLNFVVQCSSCRVDTGYGERIMSNQLMRALGNPVI
jgi:hypothetical protein